MTDSEILSFARTVVEKAATSVGPVARAEILPAEAYVSEKFWEFEDRRQWRRALARRAAAGRAWRESGGGETSYARRLATARTCPGSISFQPGAPDQSAGVR
jgi:hypothetical protein